MVAEIFDLFGNPWVDAPAKRGRPPHVVTMKTRNRVNMLVALGWTNPRIACAMGVTLPTLHKYYFYELKQRDVARDRLELRRLEMAWELAEGGNVGAFKEFGRLMERNDAMVADRAFRGEEPTEARPTKSEKVGKKELAQAAAEQAEASPTWGDDLAFRGRVN